MRFQALGSFAVYELSERRLPPLRTVLALEHGTRMTKKWYISLIAFSSVQIIVAVLSFIAFFGYQSDGGSPSVGKSREQVQSWLDTKPTRQNLNAEIMGYDTRERVLVPTVFFLQIWVLALGILSLSSGAAMFGIASYYHRRALLQPDAPPNGGPATPSDHPAVREGPSSVS